MDRAGEAITQKSGGPSNEGGGEQGAQNRRQRVGESGFASAVGPAEG